MKKRYLLLILFLVLLLPSFVYAETNFKQPKEGDHPSYLQSDETMTILQQVWINQTDRKEMKPTDVFEKNKNYQLNIQFTGNKKRIDGKINGKYPCVSSSREYEGTNIRMFEYYIGDQCSFPQEEWINLTIDDMRLGGHPVYASSNNKYTVIEDSWYNMTDNKLMTAEDVFESKKKYKYSIKFKTVFDVQDFFVTSGIYAGRFEDGMSLVKVRNQNTTGIVNDDYVILYTGNLQDLQVEEGAVVINSANTPIAGETIKALEIITNDSIQSTTTKWYLVEDGEEYEVGNNYVVQEGDILKLKVNINKEENYGIEEGFQIINHNKNYNFLSENTSINNNKIIYEATYKIKKHVQSVSITSDKPSNEEITVGDIINLTAHVFPEDAIDKSIKWSSSNSNVASVDQNGKVTVHKAGHAYIYATAVNDVYGTYYIYAYDQLESIEVSLKKLTMEIGEYRQLSVYFHPNDVYNKSITWISSNPKIATIDEDGKITALEVGEISITAKASNDMTDTCILTVVNPGSVNITNYKVKFYDEDGETVLKDTVEYPEGTSFSAIAKPSNLNKDGKVFVAWYEDKDFNTRYDTSQPLSKDLNLYGKWEDENVSITTTTEIVDYGETYVNFEENIRKRVIIKNNGNVDVKLYIVNPTNNGPFGSMGFDTGHQLRPGEEYDATLIANKNGNYHDTPGTYNGTYVVTGATLSGDKSSTLNIPTKIVLIKRPMHIAYTTHVESIGWQNYVRDGDMAGTSGKSLRLEAIKIALEYQDYTGDIEYRTQVQDKGWMSWVKNGNMSGTSHESKRLEAIEIRLTGEMAEHFDIYYRVHAQDVGWMTWAKNGERSGTEGYGRRLEGIEVILVKKGEAPPIRNNTRTNKSYVRKMVTYMTHVQDYGWQLPVEDGKMSGTSHESKRLEGIIINLYKPEAGNGIEYRTHVQSYGWMNWVSNGTMSGTSHESKRLEAIEIRLTGEVAETHDVYYRVHAENFGWMGWAKNGASAGTAHYAYRLEGIEIVVLEKGEEPPIRTDTRTPQAFIDKNAWL